MKMAGFAVSSGTTPCVFKAVATCGVAVLLLLALSSRSSAQNRPQFEINAPNNTNFRLTPDPADGPSMFFIFLEDANGGININAPIGKANIATRQLMPNGPDFNANEKLLEEARAAGQTMHMYGGAQGVGPASSAGIPSSAPPTVTDAVPCPPTSMANYWDGSAWKPLETAESIRGGSGFSLKAQLRNPLNPRYGETGILKFKGVKAPLQLGPTPRFCFMVAPNIRPKIEIGALDVKGNHRQIELTIFDATNPEGEIPPKRAVKLDIRHISTMYVVVTPASPLPSGQYILDESNDMLFDFGVQ